MVIYKCQACGDELAMTENTEKSRDTKRAWKEKHGATLILKSPKRKIPDKKGISRHSYVRLVVKRRKE